MKRYTATALAAFMTVGTITGLGTLKYYQDKRRAETFENYKTVLGVKSEFSADLNGDGHDDRVSFEIGQPIVRLGKLGNYAPDERLQTDFMAAYDTALGMLGSSPSPDDLKTALGNLNAIYGDGMTAAAFRSAMREFVWTDRNDGSIRLFSEFEPQFASTGNDPNKLLQFLVDFTCLKYSPVYISHRDRTELAYRLTDIAAAGKSTAEEINKIFLLSPPPAGANDPDAQGRTYKQVPGLPLYMRMNEATARRSNDDYTKWAQSNDGKRILTVAAQADSTMHATVTAAQNAAGQFYQAQNQFPQAVARDVQRVQQGMQGAIQSFQNVQTQHNQPYARPEQAWPAQTWKPPAQVQQNIDRTFQNAQRDAGQAAQQINHTANDLLRRLNNNNEPKKR